MRTCVRVGRCRDPPRRPRLLLRLGRAARRSAAARPSGDRRRRRRARRQLRGARPTASARRWAARQARRLCPQAVVVPPRMSAYSEASKAVFEVFHETTSAGRGPVDRRGVPRRSRHAADRGTPVEIAARLRRDVRERVGLPITVGVARTKFLAKVASGVAKPDGLLVGAARRRAGVPPPAAGRAALGRGPGHRGASCVTGASRPSGRSPSSRRERWSRSSGRAAGRHLHALAHNRDPRRVRTRRRGARSGAQRALGRRPTSWDDLDAVVVGLVDRVARRLRTARRACRTIVLRLRFDDFKRATRSHTLSVPTCETRTILTTARALLARTTPMIETRGLTLVGIALTGLEDAYGSPALAAVRSPARPRRNARRPARPVRIRRRHPRGAAGPRPGYDGAAAPGLSRRTATGVTL